MPRPPTLALALALLGLAGPGCARERRQITPTTTGTDLRAMPRGRMTPLPFPGSSLARSAPPGPRPGGEIRVDPAAATASGAGFAD